MSNYDLIATSTFGLESLVADEVKALGYDEIEVSNGRVDFRGDESAICRANLWLRTSDRVRLKVGEFKAFSFEELFEKTKALPWAEIIPSNAEFPVDGKSVKSKLYSVPDCQAIVKKAVVESMKKKYKKGWFEEKGPLFKIEVSILKDTVTLTIDTSGAGLHKRGYRETTVAAPLRENLAAALVIISRYKHDIALIDPFCGSGSIPIEAALIGLNIAPGLYRGFVSEDWPLIKEKTWREARQEAKSLADFSRELNIVATDIDKWAIRAARSNAAKANLEDLIHFQQQPLEAIGSSKKYGKIICNPPYGERLEELDDVETLYREMGQAFKSLDTWSFYVLTSHEQFELLYGKRADKRRKLYNGRIKVDYYQYYGPTPPKKKK